MDGSAELNAYELIKTPVTTPTNESIQLDNFVTKQELSADITEMIAEATPEEKQLLKQKIATLSNKIA